MVVGCGLFIIAIERQLGQKLMAGVDIAVTDVSLLFWGAYGNVWDLGLWKPLSAQSMINYFVGPWKIKVLRGNKGSLDCEVSEGSKDYQDH